ncbi:MAG TPA: hypothetical protein IAA51_14735 [Candidatus Cottocaccamicrobium excrementipullorum]|nr:hypothetical protein [Candidatus Cottocaccamicrobium excrementipullorum]
MNSLKIILGILALLLSLALMGALIWITMFGIPQNAMEGGTLVWESFREAEN